MPMSITYSILQKTLQTLNFSGKKIIENKYEIYKNWRGKEDRAVYPIILETKYG